MMVWGLSRGASPGQVISWCFVPLQNHSMFSSVYIYQIQQNYFKPCEQLIWRSFHCWSLTDWTFCRQTNVCKPAASRHIVLGMREKMQKIFWRFSSNFFFVLISPNPAALIQHRWQQGSPHCQACCQGRPQCLRKNDWRSSGGSLRQKFNLVDIWHLTHDNGPMDQWTDGLMDQWTNGPMDQWTNGPMDQWTNEPMDQWTNGPMDQWTNGPVEQWTSGPMDQWTNGPMV